MLTISYYFGVILILIGFISYFSTGQQSLTALIPSFFGLIILILSLTARNEKFRKTAMHIAMVVTLLGFLGTVPGVPKLLSLLTGSDVARPAAVVVQSVMAILCLIYIAFGIRSFILARKQG